MPRLSAEFYLREEVTVIARELLGQLLITEKNGNRTSGLIVETEAYRGPEDKASHAYNNRRTPRTEVMFGPGGHAYVYLCYGIHHLFNVVTGPADRPHAVLIRAIEPVEGLEIMMARRNRTLSKQLTSGPGLVGEALALRAHDTGASLLSGEMVWIERQPPLLDAAILATPRIGVDYAEECAAWPWRFSIRQNEWVSGKKIAG